MNDVTFAFRNMLQYAGSDFTRKRSGQPDLTLIGVDNTEDSSGRRYVGFNPGDDVKPGDILLNRVNEKLHVVDVGTDIVRNTPFQLKAFYLTEQERKERGHDTGTVFNIQNAYGSVIGNGNTAAIHYNDAVERIRERVGEETSEDKEEMEKIVRYSDTVKRRPRW